MFKKLVRAIVGDPNKKIINDLQPVVEDVTRFEEKYLEWSTDDLRQETARFRERLAAGETLADLLPELVEANECVVHARDWGRGRFAAIRLSF